MSCYQEEDESATDPNDALHFKENWKEIDLQKQSHFFSQKCSRHSVLKRAGQREYFPVSMHGADDGKKSPKPPVYIQKESMVSHLSRWENRSLFHPSCEHSKDHISLHLHRLKTRNTKTIQRPHNFQMRMRMFVFETNQKNNISALFLFHDSNFLNREEPKKAHTPVSTREANYVPLYDLPPGLPEARWWKEEIRCVEEEVGWDENSVLHWRFRSDREDLHAHNDQDNPVSTSE